MSRHAPTPRPTLLVFTLGPDADCERRPLLPRRLRPLEREVRTASLAAALEAGRACDCELEVATRRGPAERGIRRVAQQGRGFGERLASSLEASWQRNPGGPVVVVGGDTPNLAPRHVAKALRLARRDREAVVVGPSPDGGFYLLASAQPIGDALERVRWCRDCTCSDLISALKRIGRPVVLIEPLADLDRPGDLATLMVSNWSRGPARWLARRLLVALRQVLRPPTGYHLLASQTLLLPSQPRRGPPA